MVRPKFLLGRHNLQYPGGLPFEGVGGILLGLSKGYSREGVGYCASDGPPTSEQLSALA